MSNLKLARDLKSIFFNDKTFYNYNGKSSLNRFGIAPNNGKRWQTPAEIARQMLLELGYTGPYDVPDEFKQTEERNNEKKAEEKDRMETVADKETAT